MAQRTKFILEGDSAKFMAAGLKLLDQQKKSERSFQKQTKAARGLDRVLGPLGKQMLGVGAGLASVGAAVGFAVKMYGSYRRTVAQVGAANVALEKTLRPLFALGDNPLFTKGIRQDVIAKSTAFALAHQDVADAVFLSKSALDGLGPSVRDAVTEYSLLLTELGTNAKQAVAGAAGALLIYQSELDKTSDRAAFARRTIDQLVLTADLSKASQSELFQFITRPLAAGQARGFEMEDVAAMIPSASAITQSMQVAGTNVANVINRLGKAEKELDIELVGSPIEQLAQIWEAAGGDMKKMEKVFEQELSGFAAALAQLADAVKENAQKIFGVKAGLAEQKLRTIQADPQSMAASSLAQAQALAANAPAMRAANAKLAEQEFFFTAAKIGVQLRGGKPALDEALMKKDALAAAMLGVGAARVQEGIRHLEGEHRVAGRDVEADYLRVKYGVAFGTTAGTVRANRTGGLGDLFAELGGKRGAFSVHHEPRLTGAGEALALGRLNLLASQGGAVPGEFQGALGAESPGGKRVTAEEFTAGVPSGSRGDYIAELNATLELQIEAAKQMVKAAEATTAAASGRKNVNAQIGD